MKDCNYTQRVGKRNDKDKSHTMLMIINVIIKHHKKTPPTAEFCMIRSPRALSSYYFQRT